MQVQKPFVIQVHTHVQQYVDGLAGSAGFGHVERRLGVERQDHSRARVAAPAAPLPGHYVGRLWRQKNVSVEGYDTITFMNQEQAQPSVFFLGFEHDGVLHIKQRHDKRMRSDIAMVEWGGKVSESSVLIIQNARGAIKDMLWKSSALMSESRIFLGPDGLEYKWKHVVTGDGPAFADSIYWTLTTKSSSRPVATTQALAKRDVRPVGATSYPLYVSERAVHMMDWVIATLLVSERLIEE